MKIQNISLGLFGFSAQLYNFGEEKVIYKILTYLAGPFCNFLLALIFYLLNYRIEIVQINLILGSLNLLPIVPLDGGKILKEILKYFYGHKTASIFMIQITKFFLIIISLFYSVAILEFKNIAILFLIIYLWWLYRIEDRKVQTIERVYGIIEKGIEKK